LTSAITAIWLWSSSIRWRFYYDAIFRRSLLVNYSYNKFQQN